MAHRTGRCTLIGAVSQRFGSHFSPAAAAGELGRLSSTEKNMLLATWNLNNRVGKVRFRPEAAGAAMTLNADVLVLNEFFPQRHESLFRSTLADAGWNHQLMSPDSGEIANRVLVVAKVPLEPLPLELPTFDRQFPANLLCAFLPSLRISLVGVRVPAYFGKTAPMLLRSWDWLEETAAKLKNTPSVIVGDLNVSTTSARSRGGEHFRRILGDGWHRAAPIGKASYFGHGGVRTEIDHIIGTNHCVFSDAAYAQESGGFALAGLPGAISDHAALICRVSLSQTACHV